MLFLVYFLNKNYQKSKASQRVKKIIKAFIDGTTFKYNSFTTTILLPFALMAGYFMLMFTHTPTFQIQGSMYSQLGGIFVVPIFEEIVFRGIILIATIILLRWLFSTFISDKKFFGINILELNVYVFAIFINAVIFSLFHYLAIDRRYILGLIFAVSYVLDKNNLTPAIVAHMLNNAVAYYFI